MKILKTEVLIRRGAFAHSDLLDEILEEVSQAIYAIHWPQGSGQFILYPQKKGNGVVPIKKGCMSYLAGSGWTLEKPLDLGAWKRPGPVDAALPLNDGRFFVVEWETGNISSSHRALNKIALGLLQGVLAGGILILPSREMYQYLTDRIGNFPEIEPYFPMWRSLPIEDGLFAVVEVEQDGVSYDVPRILKGTDGRALI